MREKRQPVKENLGQRRLVGNDEFRKEPFIIWFRTAVFYTALHLQADNCVSRCVNELVPGIKKEKKTL